MGFSVVILFCFMGLLEDAWHGCGRERGRVCMCVSVLGGYDGYVYLR